MVLLCSMDINIHKNIDESLSILQIEKVFNEHYNSKCKKAVNTPITYSKGAKQNGYEFS